MTTIAPFPALLVDERAARRDMRRQIAALERRLERPAPTRGSRGPALLGFEELSVARDALVAAVALEGELRRAEAAVFERNRHLLERALMDPARHRWLRIPLAALGLPGCGAYAVRPRLGLIGMLAGWWHVTMSSGCP